VDLDGSVRRRDDAGPARPDVHMHGYRNPAYLAKVAATVESELHEGNLAMRLTLTVEKKPRSW